MIASSLHDVVRNTRKHARYARAKTRYSVISGSAKC